MPLPNLAQLLDETPLFSVSVVKSGDEYQANLEVERGSFRVRHGATPGEALLALFDHALFDPVPQALLPPPPY